MKKIRWRIAQFFEQVWWQNYLKKKDSKKYLKWKENYWISFLDEIQFESTNLKGDCLDIGCGPAGIFILSNKIENSNWQGVDPLISEYKKLDVFNTELYPKVVFINSSFENYTNTKVHDNIFCLNAINHFIEIEENFKKLYDLLSEEGSLVVSIDAHNYSFLKKIFYTIPMDILHPHQYTAEEYEKMISNSGFTIISKKLKKKELIFSYYIYTLKKAI